MDPAELRQLTVSVLAGALAPVVGVADSDATPWDEVELPGIRVFSQASEAPNRSSGQPSLAWSDSIALDCCVQSTTGAAAAAARDTLLTAALAALLADSDWVGACGLERISVSYRDSVDGARHLSQVVARIDRGAYERQWPQLADVDLESIRVDLDHIEDGGLPDGEVDLTVEADTT